jgi:hypothetical protein
MRRTPTSYGTVRTPGYSPPKALAHSWLTQQGQKAAVAVTREDPPDLIRAGSVSTPPAAEGQSPGQPARQTSRPGSAMLPAGVGIPSRPATAIRSAAGVGQSRPGSSAGGLAWPSGGGGVWGVERPGTAREGNRSLPALLQVSCWDSISIVLASVEAPLASRICRKIMLLFRRQLFHRHGLKRHPNLQAAHLGSDPPPSYWLNHSQNPVRPAAVRGRGRSFVDTLAAAVRNGFSSPRRAQKGPAEAWTGSGTPSGATSGPSTPKETSSEPRSEIYE